MEKRKLFILIPIIFTILFQLISCNTATPGGRTYITVNPESVILKINTTESITFTYVSACWGNLSCNNYSNLYYVYAINNESYNALSFNQFVNQETDKYYNKSIINPIQSPGIVLSAESCIFSNNKSNICAVNITGKVAGSYEVFLIPASAGLLVVVES